MGIKFERLKTRFFYDEPETPIKRIFTRYDENKFRGTHNTEDTEIH